MKDYFHDAGHMTNMAAMPIYGNTILKIQWANLDETLYVTSGTQAHESWFI